MPPKKRGSDVQTARGRLKGALQDMVNVTDDEDSLHDTTSVNHTHSNVPMRGRPPKRTKKELLNRSTTTSDAVQQTFIMKLFDRSVDLAKYKENTSLYPICRAWMINEPRSNRLTNFKKKKPPQIESRNELKDIVSDLNSGKVTEIHTMPAMKDVYEVTRVPSPVSIFDKDNIDLGYDVENPPMSRADLLADLKSRSTAARKKWQHQSVVYQEAKFVNSLRVLEHIYKP